jgi:hypothetical protein
MPINFPNNPTTNQIYIYNNQTYVWDNYKWVIQTSFVGPVFSNFIFGTLANNDLIAYNSTTLLWENKTLANLDLLTATTATSTYLTISNASTTYQPIGDYATLTGGKLDANVLPALAISDVFTVVDETAMLALTAETGDVAIRTDVNKTFILSASPATTLENWKEVLTPGGGVTSVGVSVPSGLTVSNTPITSSGTIAIALDTGYVIPTQTTLDSKATTTNYTGTLASTSWTGASAPFTKAVTVSGILSTDTPIIDLDLSSASYGDVATIQEKWGKIYRAVTSSNTITFYATEVPTINIPFMAKVVR